MQQDILLISEDIIELWTIKSVDAYSKEYVGEWKCNEKMNIVLIIFKICKVISHCISNLPS